MKGDVFSDDLVDAWITYKREHEADHVRLRPVPAEFQLYDDCGSISARCRRPARAETL